MRGFRGSRAAQAFNARFNRTQGRPEDRNHGPSPQGQGPSPTQRPQLPDWLKTPETKAQEAAGVQNPPTPAPTKPQLKLVPPPPTSTLQAKEEPKRKKSTTRKAAPVPAAKKAKTASAPRKAAASRMPKKKAS